MYILGYIVRTTLFYAIDVVLLMMFIYAIMSWIAPDMDNPFMRFIHNVVDFLVTPVRSILERLEFARTFPIDLSFTVTWLLLFVLQALLSV